MIGIFPGSTSHLPPPSNTALQFFAYTGLSLNLGATLSSILLLLAIAFLPTTARHIYMTCDHGYPRKVFNKDEAHVAELDNRMLQGDGETYALGAFGIAKGWNLMLYHCIFCFIGGCLCIFLHIGMNVWLSQSTLVAAIVMPGIVLGFVPPFLTFLFLMDGSRCHECLERYNEQYVPFPFTRRLIFPL